MTLIEKITAAFESKEWTNDRGNHVTAAYGLDGDRYLFDFKVCTPANGWEQWDTEQDAWYFGVWIHRESRQIVTYCEGDLTVVRCPTLETFRAEVADAERVYGNAPVIARAIGTDGSVTDYVSGRVSASEI